MDDAGGGCDGGAGTGSPGDDGPAVEVQVPGEDLEWLTPLAAAAAAALALAPLTLP